MNRSKGALFSLAQQSDDAELERLLEQPMEGDVKIALPRSSPAARAGVDGPSRTTVVARDPADGRILGMGTRVVRRCWYDGGEVLVGYLCNLRGDSSLGEGHRRAAGMVLRRGFPELWKLRGSDELPFDYTSILEANHAARRLLERGVRGFPRYEFVAPLSTLIFCKRDRLELARRRSPEGVSIAAAQTEELPEIAACLRRNLERFDFAPSWSLGDLSDGVAARGLEAKDFLVARLRGEICGVAAIWDQSNFKPVVVSGYRKSVRRLRRGINLWQFLRGAPRLPPPGRLSMAYLSHFAFDHESPQVALSLVDRARLEASARGLGLLALGLGSNEPIVSEISKLARPFVLESRIYRVWPPGADGSVMDARPSTARPEIAVL